MPTQSLTPGGWVQLNATTQSPLAPGPDKAEQTIGIIRQMFMAQGKQYFQIVWNPGSMFPETAMYTSDQLSPISAQSAQQIQQQMNAGTWQPSNAAAGSNYQQPNVPEPALPPGLQQTPVTPTLKGPISQPLDLGTGYR